MGHARRVKDTASGPTRVSAKKGALEKNRGGMGLQVGAPDIEAEYNVRRIQRLPKKRRPGKGGKFGTQAPVNRGIFRKSKVKGIGRKFRARLSKDSRESVEEEKEKRQ